MEETTSTTLELHACFEGLFCRFPGGLTVVVGDYGGADDTEDPNETSFDGWLIKEHGYTQEMLEDEMDDCWGTATPATRLMLRFFTDMCKKHGVETILDTEGPECLTTAKFLASIPV